MYKGKIINFDLLYTTQDRDLLELSAEHIKSEIDNSQCDAVIGLMLIDGFLYKDNSKYYEFLKSIQEYAYSKKVKKLLLVLGMCANYQEKLRNLGLEYEIISWDLYLNIVYQGYKNQTTGEWNHNAEKFLFLGGVPSRHNRIVLLSKFYTRGLLQKAEWSFFPPWTNEDKQWCREALATMLNYEQFLKDCERSIDTAYEESKDYSRLDARALLEKSVHKTAWCENPGWIDSKIFNDTMFSVISEANIYPPATDHNFLSEKTWRAVINKHPFIFAGSYLQFDYLKSVDLKSFEEYVDVYQPDDLDSVVNATVSFFKNKNEYKNKIQGDIEHNYNVYLKKVQDNQNTLEFLMSQYGIEQQEIDKWFNQKSFVHLTRIE